MGKRACFRSCPWATWLLPFWTVLAVFLSWASTKQGDGLPSHRAAAKRPPTLVYSETPDERPNITGAGARFQFPSEEYAEHMWTRSLMGRELCYLLGGRNQCPIVHKH